MDGTQYIVWFNLLNDKKTIGIPKGEGIGFIIEGFWINYKFNLTVGDDAKFWIPPSQILLIEKVQS